MHTIHADPRSSWLDLEIPLCRLSNQAGDSSVVAVCNSDPLSGEAVSVALPPIKVKIPVASGGVSGEAQVFHSTQSASSFCLAAYLIAPPCRIL